MEPTLTSDLSVHVPTAVTSRADCFIDDITQVFLDTQQNRKTTPHAVPLAVHVSCRPHAGPDEPIRRRHLLSPEKVAAEGCPIRDATGKLAQAFRDHLKPSPFHVKNSSHLIPSVRALLSAFDKLDRPPNRQNKTHPPLPQDH